MDAPWIAALPMYDYPEVAAAHDALWECFVRHFLATGLNEGAPPPRLTRGVGKFDIWRHPRLLLGQGCEYPLAKSFADDVRLVASPCYIVPGCSGATYRSAIVVRCDDAAQDLIDLRDRRCTINESNSNSGMNLLRAAIAPLAGGMRFFESVVVSGAHRQSAHWVAGGEADVAALDCVSWAHIQRVDPAIASKLRVLCWTASSPSLPFITTHSAGASLLQGLRSALKATMTDPSIRDARETLFLEDVHVEPDESFSDVLRLERRAADFGYTTLA
jgi:ABC-type phosphate/phosphonate transport system substrate-binding protein